MSSEKQNSARASLFRVTGHHLFVVKQIGTTDLCGRVPAFSELVCSSNKKPFWKYIIIIRFTWIPNYGLQ
jgi:hypothetical protein